MGMGKIEVCSRVSGYRSQSVPANPTDPMQPCSLVAHPCSHAWVWRARGSFWLALMWCSLVCMLYVRQLCAFSLNTADCGSSGEAAGLTCCLWHHPGILRIELQWRLFNPDCRPYLGTWLIDVFCHPQWHLSFQNVQLRCTEIETFKGTEQPPERIPMSLLGTQKSPGGVITVITVMSPFLQNLLDRP